MRSQRKQIKEDKTLSRNNISYMLFLTSEYELVKAKKHPRYRSVTEFYKANNLKRQNFIKYYNRFINSNRSEFMLLPQKRGPKYKTRRITKTTEEAIIALRKQGFNKYEIYLEVQEKLKDFTPSLSTIYNVFKRNGLNRLKPKQQRNKVKIMTERAGELGHIDCHYLPKGIIENDSNRYYLVALIDSYSRVVWAELVPNIKAITVMFASLKMLNTINSQYKIKFETILTDNGSEFGSGKHIKNKEDHPFEVMLSNMGIKHRYTKPYRPQTNGKVERFWKTLKFDLLDDMVFDSIEHLKDELLQYIVYYNEQRPHQAIDGNPPASRV